MFNVKKMFKLILVISIVTIVTPANSAGFDSLLKTTESLTGVSTKSTSSDLLGSLTTQLGVTESQAAGGTAALLSMASQNLSGTDSSLLKSIIPAELSTTLSSQMLNQVMDMAGVQSAFSALGLDASMVQQFAPILLQYLTANGGSDLLGSLTKLWL
ncbi:DUF2780 domain-containing protein [Psychromonas sp. MB-3u-54]|uniref:DUF2780 domain-containing protein n=1 Tax=Psychromonas sp. MB-3u-54 TaxID=2058319 RepID=UPI0012FF495B|nr:DUF2780 domain-containing protein [Psychromonas sp. MB-3u-54]